MGSLKEDVVVGGVVLGVGVAAIYFLARGIGKIMPSLPNINFPAFNFPEIKYPEIKLPSMNGTSDKIMGVLENTVNQYKDLSEDYKKLSDAYSVQIRRVAEEAKKETEIAVSKTEQARRLIEETKESISTIKEIVPNLPENLGDYTVEDVVRVPVEETKKIIGVVSDTLRWR